MKTYTDKKEEPSTVIQIAAAMQALGLYNGQNIEEEHRAEAARIGDEAYYHMLLVNALLGGVEIEALHADSSDLKFGQMQAAHKQALETAGVEDTPEKLMNFLRWRTLRIEGPLRQIVQNEEVGPVPFAAAHAAEALQLLLSACASGQNIAEANLLQMAADLKSARESLTNALVNLDIMIELIEQIENL